MKTTKNEYQMKLYDEPFELIKSGKKTIEVRCNDEKRQKLKIGDRIIFKRFSDPNDEIYAEIIDLQCFATFRELYSAYPMDKFGVEGASIEDKLSVIDQIYSKEEQEKFGAAAIVIKLICDDFRV